MTPGKFVDMSLGDPGYSPPREALAAVAAFLRTESRGYAPRGGFRWLREALAEKLRKQNVIDASADEVVVTTGASHGIFAVLAALCQPGDTIIIPDPGFPHYRLAARILGLSVQSYSLDADRGNEPDWDAIERSSAQARVLIWNFPSNPLGVDNPQWNAKVLELIGGHPGLFLLSDEVYEDLIFAGDHQSPAAVAGPNADRIASVFSFSKSYAMTGWRVGYVHARPDLGAAIARCHWGVSMSTPTVAQVAALAALHAPPSYLLEYRAFLTRNRDIAVQQLNSAGYRCSPPTGGFFLWTDISGTQLGAAAFAERSARELKVLVSPGTDFSPSATDRVRLSFALSETQLRDGLERLCRWSPA
jgi:aspartate aminotransferase